MKQIKNLLIALQDNLSIYVVTIVEAPLIENDQLGQMLALYLDGRIEGHLVNEEITSLILNHIQTSKWEKAILFQLENLNGYKFFWDKWGNNRKALVLGGGHISQPLVEILAMLDFDVTVVDDRSEFANATRFPRAYKVICNNFSNVLESNAIIVTESTAVIIVTRGHRYDMECLRRLVETKAAYIGMIGSRSRVKGIIQLLSDQGISTDCLQRLRSPIGIDIGATTPVEIALSIVMEIMAVFNSSSLKPLSIRQREDLHA